MERYFPAVPYLFLWDLAACVRNSANSILEKGLVFFMTRKLWIDSVVTDLRV